MESVRNSPRAISVNAITFLNNIMCIIVISKIDENRCKQTLASLP